MHVPMQYLPAKTTHSRTAILGVGMITLAIAGLLYAWSIFVAPLETEFGWNRSQTSLTFSLSMVFWSVGLLVNGQMAKRLPPKGCYAVARSPAWAPASRCAASSEACPSSTSATESFADSA